MKDIAEARIAHVIATVDLDAATGAIQYVIPSEIASNVAADPAAGLDPAAPKVETVTLVERDGAGAELRRSTAEVRMDADHPGDASRAGIVQHDLSIAPGTQTIELEVGGKVVDRFVAGASPAASLMGMTLGAPVAASGHRRTLESMDAGMVAEEPGVSYTVQARPDTSEAWTTLAVGLKQPKFALDRNQFPSAKEVEVRVVRNTGLAQSVVSSEKIALNWS